MNAIPKGAERGGFSVRAGDLRDALDRFKYVMPKKAGSSVLNHILFYQSGNRLGMQGGSYAENAYFTLDVEPRSAEVRMLVPYSQIIDFLGRLPDAATLTCTQTEVEDGVSCLQVEGSHGNGAFQGLGAEKAPSYQGIQAGYYTSLGADIFLDMAARTIFSADTWDFYGIDGVYFHFLQDRTNFVATNRFILSLYSRMDIVFPLAKSVIVPVTALQAFIHGIKGLSSAENIDIRTSNGRIQLSYGGFILNSVLIDGPYPNYQNKIPTDTPYMGTFELEKLRKAIKRLLPSKDRDLTRIEFTFEGNKATLLAQDDKLKEIATEVVACKYSGEAFKISFHGESLLSILENIGGERIAMRMTNTVRPVIIEPAQQSLHLNMLCLIMPLADPM